MMESLSWEIISIYHKKSFLPPWSDPLLEQQLHLLNPNHKVSFVKYRLYGLLMKILIALLIKLHMS